MNASVVNGPQVSQTIREPASYVKQHTGYRWDSLKAPLIIDDSAAMLLEVSSPGSVSMVESSFRNVV